MKKEIALACFGTCLSGLLGYLTTELSTLSVAKLLIITILLLLVISSLVLMGPLGDMLTPSKFHVKGEWIFEADGAKTSVSIAQKGSRITMKGKSINSQIHCVGHVEPSGVIIGTLDMHANNVVIRSVLYIGVESEGTCLQGFLINSSNSGERTVHEVIARKVLMAQPSLPSDGPASASLRQPRS